MANDPTMELIRSLDDPARYVAKEHVAVFRPHKRDFPAFKLPDGKNVPAKTIEVTDADLPQIAANINRLYEKEGQLVKLVIGHRQQHPLHPETNQPPVVGYARNYRAEVVDRPGGKAIRLTHTEYVRRDTPQSAAVLNGQYPERSPEYDPERKIITAVALLTRDQALPLGTVAYEDGRTLYAMGADMPEMMPAGAPAGAGSGDEWSPEDDVQYGRFCKYMKKYQSTAPAAMGPMNGAMPSAPVADGAPPLGYSAAAGTINYSADPHVISLKTRIAELEAQKAQSDRLAVQAQCQSMLEPVRAQRKFNYERELNALMAMKTPEERAMHLHYMLDNYLPLPGGDMLRLADTLPYAARPTGDAHPAFTKPANYDRAREILDANPGMGWEEAKRQAAAA